MAKAVSGFIKTWAGLGPYQRFEQLVAVLLTLLISVVIVAASARLAIDIYVTVAGGFATLDDHLFEEIFGRIMTVLIALEFNHSILQVIERKRHLIQVRTVVLIVIVAIARKFIIIDLDELGAETLVALAVIAAALAAVYWVLDLAERKDRE
jgi:uncharacterized membrane protein (DUF373 family)